MARQRKKYNNSGVSACGQANAVDSLAVIRKLVFEDKKYTLKELADAAYHDFEGQEDMLQVISSTAHTTVMMMIKVDWMMADLTAALRGIDRQHQNTTRR